MNRIDRVVLFPFLILTVFPPVALARGGEKSWFVAGETAVNSRYIWRGLGLVDEPVWQTSLSGTYKWFSISAWGNLDLTDVNGRAGRFSEVNGTLDFSFSHSILNFSLGSVYYFLPYSREDSTLEIYATSSLDHDLSPSLSIYQDVIESKGIYLNVALDYQRSLHDISESSTVGLAPALALGIGSPRHNEYYYCEADGGGCVDDWAFTDLSFSLGIPLTIRDDWRVTPNFGYVFLLDGDIRKAINNDRNLCIGLKISFEH